jgi:CHAD domain-containing protein
LKAGAILEEYIKKRTSVIDSFFIKPHHEFLAEDFHQLRVEIKKINAGFELISFCTKDFDRKKYYKPYQNVFKQAGKLREMHVQESILTGYKQYGSLKHFNEDFKKKEAHESEKFFLLLNEGLKLKLAKNQGPLVHFFERINEKCVDEFIREQQKKIKIVTRKSNLAADQIHRLRKRLKDIGYIRKLFLTREYKAPKNGSVQSLLGQWHDHDVITRNLQKVISKGNIIKEEIKDLRKIEKKISAKATNLLKKINSSPDFYFPA